MQLNPSPTHHQIIKLFPYSITFVVIKELRSIVIMKSKAATFLKQIMTLLSSIAKAKSLAIKSKTSAAKARLIMLSLVKNKKVLLDTVSHKFHSLLGHHHQDHDKDHQSQDADDEADRSKAIVLYNDIVNQYSRSVGSSRLHTIVDDEDKYPDLRHTLFDENENFDDLQNGTSVIDMVRDAKAEGEDFSLEDEIDHVADLFIKRFHKQMRMQKLLSFKRQQAEMLDRSV